MRKIIQIITAIDRDNRVILHAFCDDESIWMRVNNKWHRVEDIPQDKPEPLNYGNDAYEEN